MSWLNPALQVSHQDSASFPLKIIKKSSDEESVNEALPGGHGGDLGAISIDLVPRELPTSRIDVNLGDAQPGGPLPNPAADPETNDDLSLIHI